MKYLITGGCGFVGSNLASEVLRRGEELFIYDNLYRSGTEENLKWLKSQGQFCFYPYDIRCYSDVQKVIQKNTPDVIFHLAGQVAMKTSIQNPRLDFETNVLGTFNILESARQFSPESIIIYSSTNKGYGDLEYVEYEETQTRYIAKDYPFGFDEKISLDFHSPYGCSKGAADQYMLDYNRIFDLKTVVFRHSSIFGIRQFGTFDQGWVSWFIQKAIETLNQTIQEPFTISGNGKQVRDVLFAEDLINCYFGAINHIDKIKGNAFNIGGGIENSLSLLELFMFLEKELEIKLNYQMLSWRESDQKVFVADIRKAKNLFEWYPQINQVQALQKMIQWVKQNQCLS